MHPEKLIKNIEKTGSKTFALNLKSFDLEELAADPDCSSRVGGGGWLSYEKQK